MKQEKNIWIGYTREGLDVKDSDIVFYDVNNSPFEIKGLYGTENKFHRMPQKTADTISPAIADRHRESSGGRIRFETNSSSVAIRVKMRKWGIRPHMSALSIAGFSLYVKENGRERFVKSFLPALDDFEEYEGIYKTSSSDMREYTLYMPIFNEIYSLEVGLKKEAAIKKHTPYRYEKPVVFYGSSITHGCSASRPGNSYEGFISRKLDCNYYNLGFSGNAKGETNMAKYIAGLNMSAFVLDYDHNAPTIEHLKNTHEEFYRIVREKNPDLPIVIVSRPGSNIEYNMSRKDIILETYLNARKNGDKKVWFVDGNFLFEDSWRFDCTVDGVHPNDLGFKYMADAIGPVIKKALEEF